MLESKETGVSIVIPKGAIKLGVQQEIYFKVCQDNSILPPLDEDKGNFVRIYKCYQNAEHMLSFFKIFLKYLKVCFENFKKS